MIKQILAFLASLPRRVFRTVLKAGRFVVEAFYEPAPVPAISAEVEAAASAPAADNMPALRRIGCAFMNCSAPAPADLGVVPEKAIRWMKTMEKRELARLLTADNAAIASHMRGRTPIRGVIPFDDQAIRDVAAARKPAPEPQRRRTLRDLVEGQPSPAF